MTSGKLNQVWQKQAILISALEQKLYALELVCSAGAGTSRYGASSSAVTTPPFDEIYCPICEFIERDTWNLLLEKLINSSNWFGERQIEAATCWESLYHLPPSLFKPVIRITIPKYKREDLHNID